MQLLTIAAIVAGVIATIIGLIIVVKRISEFYKQKFQFSIWSGVLLMVLAMAFGAVAVTPDISKNAIYALVTLAAILAIITISNDIRLAGVGWGLATVGLQILFACCFVFLILFVLIGYVLRKAFNLHNSVLSSIFGTGLGMRGEMLFLLKFLHI